MTVGPCALCERTMFLTAHHLIPKKLHKKYEKRKVYTEQQLLTTVDVCRPCHSAIHRIFTHAELGTEYNTVEKYLENDAVLKWVSYAQKQPDDSTNKQMFGLRYSR